ncbi:MAG: CDP-diacylglycerol--glycerol-3-phosphate 3-phosphatidyltransferase [Oscillospiraceae bacterium]
MNTANKLTLLRVAMIPLFLVILYWGFPGSDYAALAVFILASLTDFADGYIARHCDQVTDFGKFMDPLADKVLVVTAMLWFVQCGRLPAWAVAVVIFREFAVSGMRLIAAERGRVIAAGWSGKVKTASTMVGLCLMFLPLPGWVTTACVTVIVVTTLYSGIEYFVKNRDIMDWSNL